MGSETKALLESVRAELGVAMVNADDKGYVTGVVILTPEELKALFHLVDIALDPPQVGSRYDTHPVEEG